MQKLLILISIFSILTFSQTKLTVEDLWNLKRIENFDVTKDGKTIVFNIVSYNMEENKGNRDIYIINADGSNLKALKDSKANESNPMFSPDNKKIAYLKDGQIWTCNIDGSNDEQLTNIYTKVNEFDWSADGKKLLFISSVYPECQSDECNKNIDETKEKSKVKAEIFTELMYRHWNDWRGNKRGHLFLFDVDKKEQTDLTLFSKFDVPPIALGSSNDYSFSVDGSEVAFTLNTSDTLAISTNNDIFLINLNDVKKGEKTPYKKISESLGNDNQPVYSPDGRYIAYTSMKRAGFEADKLRLMLFDRTSGKVKDLTEKIDLSVGEFIWSPDSKSIYFETAVEIYHPIYKIDITNSNLEVIVKDHNNSAIELSEDGSTLFFKQEAANHPTEIFSYNLESKQLNKITNINKDLLAKIEMNPAETFWSNGAGGTKVQSIIIKPPFFDANKKYPMMFLIHGGPQGNWSDEFHYRWNTQMFAAQGYVVVAVNPRGSTGYGQKYVDEISQDWGGKPYTDLMNAYDFALHNFKFIDKKNTFAAGASYGGYMINWIEGHTDRFNALVSHAGVFNLESMYGTTEELWFAEWENGGTPWNNRKLYEKFSPHRYIQNAKTPLLVVHGAYDFRVPEEQGFQLFTSLQRLGVKSKFLYFPDEFHFVTKPQNAKLWWNTLFDWFKQFRKES
ncbi:MAG TPA: S9 family peptidase [Ignavibacteriaceae bacterium]|nr:S9 family peptidase [Ignavibacteriaceae bacterium]